MKTTRIHNKTWDGNRLPNHIRDNVGKVLLEKGTWRIDEENEFFLNAWDFSIPCAREKCVVHSRCIYVRHWNMREDKLGSPGYTDKCKMQQRYLRSVIYAFVDKMRRAGKNEQEQVLKLGYSLIPLYAQLFKFKLYEYANNDVMVYSPRGDSKINPVYKEIREIIKTIGGVWREIGGSVKEADTSAVGDDAFIDALYCVNEDDKVRESGSEEGSGVDFGEESSAVSEEGEGLDVDYSDVKHKKRDPRTFDKKQKRKRKKVKKEKPVVLSPMQRIRKMHAEKREMEKNDE